MIDTFDRATFEAAIPYEFTPQGVIQGNYAYLLDFGNPDVKIMLYSSIGPDGHSRGDGEDSIRAWLVGTDGRPIGGKTQRWVTRKPGWAGRMEDMLDKVANLGRWLTPCPVCGKVLALAVKGSKAYVFCPTDAANKDNRQWKRHVQFLSLDKDTGESS